MEIYGAVSVTANEFEKSILANIVGGEACSSDHEYVRRPSTHFLVSQPLAVQENTIVYQ
jgi:hypothetical protein